MSLLLDALKKAAEQKEKQAEAAKLDASPGADEISVPDVTETELVHGEDNTEVSEVNYAKVGLQDDGKLDSAQSNYDRDEDTQVVPVDDTEYDQDVPTQYDATETQRLEDETVLIVKDDGEDAVEMTQALNEPNQDDEDDSQLTASMSDAADDQTEIVEDTRIEVEPPVVVEDQTEVVEATRIDLDASGDDDDYTVDVSEKTVIIETDDQTEMPSFDEDETMSLLSNEDVSDFLSGRSAEERSTVSSDDTEISTRQATVVDDDLSLNLVEQDSLDDTTANDPHTRGTDVQMLVDANVDTEGLALVDVPHSGGNEQTSTVTTNPDDTVTAGIELESLRNENTIIRQDSTSTNTYAPDNYDRTLIRPANDDASRIFAGMKSDEDVLMTPDYAKRVFLSKSSANRLQYYKVYIGIAVSILLAIGIFALFELQDEYNRIDTALTPLKQDPMPGVIRKTDGDSNKNLFGDSTEPDADRKTLKLVENAQIAVVEVDTSDVSQVTTVVEEAPKEDVVAESVRIPESNTNSSDAGNDNQDARVVATLDNTVGQIPERNIQQEDQIQTDEESASTLKISSKQEFTEKDQWLSEAYQAYQRGDDVSALRKYNQVLEVDPKNRNALLARAAISIQNNDISAAIIDYQQLLLDNPKDSLAMSSLISVANLSPQDSETQLKLMIRDEPDSPYLNFVLANVYGAQNRWQEAQGLYFKALENNPDDPNYAYNLAVSLEHISKPKVAAAYYERAVNNIDNGLATFNKDVVDQRIELLRQL